MASDYSQQLSKSFRNWWHAETQERGVLRSASLLVTNIGGFVRDSMPDRQRQRYGDMEYDWDYRVNTTSGAVGWRERLLGLFLSPYQPTEPTLFREMMSRLPIQFSDFTFLDLGSGKGRTLLMASDFPFRRIIGVEIVPALHQIAMENLSTYRSTSQKCFTLEPILGDAADFNFPDDSFVLYLFNPLPQSGLRRMMANLVKSLKEHPRKVYLVYHNPLLEQLLREDSTAKKLDGSEHYSIYVFG